MSRIILILLAASALGACKTTPAEPDDRAELRKSAQEALDRTEAQHESLSRFLSTSYGYAVFPKISAGAAGVGGAYGRGVVYQQGVMVGYADMTQLSAGAQLGGQTYTEIVAFEDKEAMTRFRERELVIDAQASAVAVEAGTGTGADFHEGIAIFAVDRKGLMLEASVAGQRFSFEPL